MTPEEWAANRGTTIEAINAVTDCDFLCIHRGEVLRQAGCGCGAKKQKMDVLACSVHGECTIHSPGKSLRKSDKSGRVAVCITCDQRTTGG